MGTRGGILIFCTISMGSLLFTSRYDVSGERSVRILIDLCAFNTACCLVESIVNAHGIAIDLDAFCFCCVPGYARFFEIADLLKSGCKFVELDRVLAFLLYLPGVFGTSVTGSAVSGGCSDSIVYGFSLAVLKLNFSCDLLFCRTYSFS